MKTLSVLIAAFNAEDWLADCIDSIETQQLPTGWQLQILLGVDGCRSTLQAAHQLKNKALTIVSLAENHGTYVTFNTLMKYAKGQLICRFDADDVMLPGYFKAQIEHLQHNSDMTMTWSIYTDEKLQPTSILPALKNYKPEGGRHPYGTEGQFIIKRSVWDSLGGFQPWRCSADTEFRDRVKVLGGNISVVEDYLYYRRSHANSLTAHPDTRFGSEHRNEIFARIDEYNKQHDRALKIEPICGEVEAIYN